MGARLGRGIPNRPTIVRNPQEAPPAPPDPTTWSVGEPRGNWHTETPQGRWETGVPRGRWHTAPPRGE